MLICGSMLPGRSPGAARIAAQGNRLLLENDLLAVSWDVAGGLRLLEAKDKRSGVALSTSPSECLQIVHCDSPSPGVRTIKGSEMDLIGHPIVKDAAVSQVSGRRSEGYAGKELVVCLAARDRRVRVEWRATLRDQANYIRQSVTIEAPSDWVELSELILLDFAVEEATVHGSVDGSPAGSGLWFMGVEHPASRSAILEEKTGSGAPPTRIRCSYPFAPPLAPGERQEYSAVLGLVPEGQLRRGFLYYLERERAHPYRPFLLQSPGEDMGALYTELRENPQQVQEFSLKQEEWWRAVIEDFGRELVWNRNVVIDCFAHDHLWDDPETPWQFVADRFPEGFAKARSVAQEYGASLGVWFSPDAVTSRPGRVVAGRAQRFEGFRVGTTNEALTLALSLAGRRYYARVRSACVNMLLRYGVDYFKFDGIADGYDCEYKPDGPGQHLSDYEALLRLMAELRELKPDVFINASTGAWPSPFLLRWADCIWHQGADVGRYGPDFKGWSKGSPRQRWLTYRDSATYHNGLLRGPLYPLNSYMLHGLEFNLTSRGVGRLRVRGLEAKDIVDEIRSYFGTGANLQEMYTHASVMTPQTWDVLAEAARWSRANADVLQDTHWVGGDPSQHQVYGWASWTPRKGILALRNPDDRPQSIDLDIADAFELPEDAPQKYRLQSPWRDQAEKEAIEMTAGTSRDIQLDPFEVLVLDASPVG